MKYTPLILNEIKLTLSILLKRVTPSAPKKAIIYSNMRQKVEYLNADNELYKIDYVLIHGQLSHQEKAVYLKRFMSNSTNRRGDIHVSLETSGVANVGINNKEIHTAIRVEFSAPSIKRTEVWVVSPTHHLFRIRINCALISNHSSYY